MYSSFSICSCVYLLFGSNFIMFFTNFLNPSSSSTSIGHGILYGFFSCSSFVSFILNFFFNFSYSSTGVLALNKYIPVAILYSIHPSDHISACVVCLFPPIISGAINIGDPANVSPIDVAISFATPKSAIFSINVFIPFVNNIFAGFKSLCPMLTLCSASIPLHNCNVNSFNCSPFILLFFCFCKCSFKFPSLQYSIIIYICCVDFNTSINFITFSCVILFIDSISPYMYFACPESIFNLFIAIYSFVIVLIPLNTCPKFPLPNISPKNIT
mmetsp:Transcript_2215/g.3208  ORF Transcript_2215/g.3208 Transcript_2215/m.3208 type:complete len:271 (-) Transcript_2215:91-903(-)